MFRINAMLYKNKNNIANIYFVLQKIIQSLIVSTFINNMLTEFC